MKPTSLLACISFFLAGPALAASPNSNSTSIKAPPGFKPIDVHPPTNVVTTTGAKPAAVAAAAATQYWVCLAISTGTFQWGAAQGGSESSALAAAKKKCVKKDCTFWRCIELGCIGLDFGNNAAHTSYAQGYGPSATGPKAASVALAGCKKSDTGCAKPGYFCSSRV